MRRQLLDKRMKRRDFLKASSAAVTSPAIVAIGDHGGREAAAMPALANETSLTLATKVVNGVATGDLGDVTGFLTGRFAGAVTVGYYDGAPNGYFIDARSLPEIDDTPSGGLSIQVIDGELLGQPDLGGIRSLSLSFDLRPGRGHPLQVWYRQFAPIPQSSAAMSFTLPRDAGLGRHCWLNARFKESPAALERIPISFGPDATGGIDDLRSGYYAIAVTQGNVVDWKSVQLRGSCDGNALCLNANGSPLSDVPWVLLTVTPTRA